MSSRRRESSAEVEVCAHGLLKPLEAAHGLGISRSSLYDLLRAGLLPYCLIGADKRVPRRALVEFAESRLKLGTDEAA